MKQKKLKYSLEDPMVGTLCGLLLFLTVGCLFAGGAQSRTAFKIGIDAAFGGANKGFTGYIAESDINEKTVNAIEELLSKDDRFTVMRTHAAQTEAAVLDTAAKINEEQPQLVLSIHGGWDPDETVSGTRVYLSLEEDKDKAIITFKNTSRDALNIPAEELMERFKRGDESRNSEGNGLGLSIAQSLAQLQNGDLSLSIDGDLFKAILTFDKI